MRLRRSVVDIFEAAVRDKARGVEESVVVMVGPTGIRTQCCIIATVW
jgi:hypothetical protein